MGMLFDKSLRDIIELSSSKSPTPGGGSISAIAGALGLSMAAMVCNLTLGKEKYSDVEPEVKIILKTAEGLINRLMELTGDDIKVFSKVMSAYRMPRASDEEKEAREAAVQEALKGATEIPMEIARACLKALQVSCRLASIGNKTAVSDAGVAAVLAEAALSGALLNVDINTPMIKDRDYSDRILAEKEKLLKEAGILKERSLAIVRERINS